MEGSGIKLLTFNGGINFLKTQRISAVVKYIGNLTKGSWEVERVNNVFTTKCHLKLKLKSQRTVQPSIKPIKNVYQIHCCTSHTTHTQHGYSSRSVVFQQRRQLRTGFSVTALFSKQFKNSITIKIHLSKVGNWDQKKESQGEKHCPPKFWLGLTPRKITQMTRAHSDLALFFFLTHLMSFGLETCSMNTVGAPRKSLQGLIRKETPNSGSWKLV